MGRTTSCNVIKDFDMISEGFLIMMSEGFLMSDKRKHIIQLQHESEY